MRFKKGDILVHKRAQSRKFKVIKVESDDYILLEIGVWRGRTNNGFPISFSSAHLLLKLIKTRNHPLTNIFER